jgi:WD40 repeat protein
MENGDAFTANELNSRDIVCVYSQADESFYLQIKKSLNLLERQGQICWLEVLPGENHSATLRHEVKRADLILLLLSPDFFPDELCYQTMHLALQERTSRQVPVVPILVRAVNWRLSACKDLAIVPHNEQPIASWALPDEAYASIGADLVHLVPGWPPIPLPTRPKLFQARDLPEGYVLRPKTFGKVKHLLLNRQDGQSAAITTALRGAGGFGKTTLALALCHDPEIQVAFPDGILWVELGEQPPRPIDALNGVLASLEASLSGAITLEEARDRWRKALQDRVCLLVIDDVWQAEALRPLLEGGPRCVRLITTRNNQVLPEEAMRIPVDAMEPEEAATVLGQRFPKGIQLEASQLMIERLARRLGYWPLLLTLAQGMLASLVTYGQSIAEALSEIEQAYETRGVDAFYLEQVGQRQRSVEACLEVSLLHLERFTRPYYHQAVERYQELAIFPEDTDIPISTLSLLWQGSGGLSSWETKGLCMHLHQLSLLLTCDLGAGTVRLHDVMRSYLLQRGKAALPMLHVRLLNASWQGLGLRRWADLPVQEHYLWQHLIFHICQTGHLDALKDTLSDLGYLARKALYVGISALETDLLLASTWPSFQSVFPLVTELYRTIVRISHLLRQASEPAGMGGVLLSYLPEELVTADQRRALERELPRPFLIAWHPLPNRTSSALRRTLFGHTYIVRGCAVSGDGRLIVSASEDGTLKVWDAASGAERLTLFGHTSAVRDCAMSGDGRLIVSASDDGTLKVWDTASGDELHTLRGHTGAVRGCAVSGDGRLIISASADHTLKVWDAASGIARLTLSGHTKEVFSCAVSGDGRLIISASADHTLKVWDAPSGTELHTLSGHTNVIWGCAVSGDGRMIVSASLDGTLKVWDAPSGTELHTLSGHTNWITDCAVSEDGRLIVSSSFDRTLKVWDAASGTELHTLSGHTNVVWGCAVSRDGRLIVSSSFDRTLKVWDAASGAERPTPSGHTSYVLSCAISGDGRLTVSASSDRTLKVWDATSGAERLTLFGHTDDVSDCAISGDGRLIVSASSDRTLKVWDATSGAERLTLSGHTGAVRGCAISGDGRLIVSASSDRTLKVWDAISGAERLTLSGHTGEVRGCAISEDSRLIVSASSDGTLKVWDAASGTELRTLSGHTGEVRGCTISEDGHLIVSASSDRTLKVWDTASGTEHLTLSGHTWSVLQCTVSGDSRLIVSASADGTLKVWDATYGTCLLTFPMDGELYGCAFHPDGEHLVACGHLGMSFLRMMK